MIRIQVSDYHRFGYRVVCNFLVVSKLSIPNIWKLAKCEDYWPKSWLPWLHAWKSIYYRICKNLIPEFWILHCSIPEFLLNIYSITEKLLLEPSLLQNTFLSITRRKWHFLHFFCDKCHAFFVCCKLLCVK